MSVTASLSEITQAQNLEPEAVISSILANIEDDVDKARFLDGLSARIIAMSNNSTPEAQYEIDRWLGSWILSGVLMSDLTFQAHDREAQQLLRAGKLTDGCTTADLRRRYR